MIASYLRNATTVICKLLFNLLQGPPWSNPIQLKLEKQTKEAQELLSDIFVEEQPAEAKKPSGEVEAVRDILSQLLEKEVWEFAEVDEICKSKGLMTGYVLEKINDLSYEKVDDAVVDQDGDQVFVTTDYKEQLI